MKRMVTARWLLVGTALALSGGVARAECVPIDPTHAAWTAILARRVESGRVDYAALKEDRGPLDAYTAALSRACAADYDRWSEKQRIAFWLNAYNANTVRLVVDHYPIASIRSIGWLPLAAFRERFIPMPGLRGGFVSLNDIEHETLRKDFREPRIHFALVCAARSCPPLRAEAYRGADLDRQLDDQGRAFLRDRTKNRWTKADGKLELSSIFKWFRGDFEAASGSLHAFVSRYVADGPIPADVPIEFLEYDWSLNDRR